MFKWLLLVILLGIGIGCVPVPTDLGEVDSNPRISSLSPVNPMLNINPASGSQLFSIVVSDVEEMGYVVHWYLDGIQQVSGSSQYTLNPAPLSDGSYTVSVTVSDSSGLVIYDAQNWVVVVASTTYFTATPVANSTIEVMDSYEIGTPGKWTYSGANIDPRIDLAATLDSVTNWTVRFYDDQDNLIGEVQTNSTIPAMRSIALSDADPNYKADLVDNYIYVKVFSPAMTQVGYTVRWNLVVNPITISIGHNTILPTAGTTIDVLNGGAVSVAGNWTQTMTTVDPGVSVTDSLGSDSVSGIRYEFYTSTVDGGAATTHINSLTTTASGTVTLSAVAPAHSYTLVDAFAAETHTLLCRVYDVFTGKQIGSDISWTLNVIPTTSTVNISATFPANGSTITAIDGIDNSISGAWTQGIDASPGVTVDSNNGSPRVTFEHCKSAVCNTIGVTTLLSAGVMTRLSDVDPGFDIPLTTSTIPESNHTIKATVTDLAGNPIGSVQSWNIYVRPKNTPPNVSATLVPEGVVTGIVERVSKDFVISISDDDTALGSISVNWVWDPTGSNEALDGTVGAVVGSIWEGITKPNCDGTALTATTCTITIPSYNSVGAIDPAAYDLKVTVTDQPANGALATSTTLTWNLAEPVEAQTDSVLDDAGINVTFVGTASIAPTIAAATYIYDIAGGAATSLAGFSEGDEIAFNVAVYDPDQDDFTLNIEWKLDVDPDSSYTALAGYPITVNRTASATVYHDAYNFQVPEEWAASDTSIDIRITVTDLPKGSASGSAVPMSYVFDAFSLTESNPNPTFAVGSYNPLLDATFTVVAGFPFSIDHGGTIANPPWSNNDDLIYQWQVTSNVAAPCGGGSGWTDIVGATDPDNFVWTPPLGMNDHIACFRLCVGDKNFGGTNNHDDDCSALIVGAWSGTGAHDFITIKEPKVEIENLGAESIQAVQSIEIGGVVYSAYLVNGALQELHLRARDLGASGYELDVAGWVDIARDLDDYSSNDVDGIDLTMTINGNDLLLAYSFADITTIPGTTLPGVRILHYQIDTGADTLTLMSQWTSSVLHDGIGQIMTDGTKWYLPVIDMSQGNKISVLYDVIALPSAGNTSDIKLTNSIITQSGKLHNLLSDSGDLILMVRNSTGDWSLQQFDDLNALCDSPGTTGLAKTDAVVSEDLDIFGNITFGLVDLELERTSDNLLVIGASSGANGLYRQYNNIESNDLANADSLETLSASAGFIDFHIVPVASGQYVIPYVDTGDDLYLMRLNTATSSLVQSSMIQENITVGLPITTTGLIAGHTAGDSGAIGGENNRDVIILNYEDGNSVYGLILNTEEESISATATGAGFFPGFF